MATPSMQQDDTPDCLYAMGDIGLLRTDLLGLVGSVRCPGSVVLKTFDAVRGLRDGGVALVGGFHSPMERESLDILLRGRRPVVLCSSFTVSGIIWMNSW